MKSILEGTHTRLAASVFEHTSSFDGQPVLEGTCIQYLAAYKDSINSSSTKRVLNETHQGPAPDEDEHTEEQYKRSWTHKRQTLKAEQSTEMCVRDGTNMKQVEADTCQTLPNLPKDTGAGQFSELAAKTTHATPASRLPLPKSQTRENTQTVLDAPDTIEPEPSDNINTGSSSMTIATLVLFRSKLCPRKLSPEIEGLCSKYRSTTRDELEDLAMGIARKWSPGAWKFTKTRGTTNTLPRFQAVNRS